MVQTADFGERNDLSLIEELHWSRFRGIFLQAQVSSASVIVCEVGFEEVPQMGLVEDDDVVQAFAAN